MGRPPVEVVAAFFDLEARDEVLASDVEFLPLTGEVHFGPAGVAHALDEIAEHFRDYSVSPAEFIPADEEHVLVRLRRVGVTRRSDVPISDTFAQIFTVRDGVIVRMESFKTLAEARKALAG